MKKCIYCGYSHRNSGVVGTHQKYYCSSNPDKLERKPPPLQKRKYSNKEVFIDKSTYPRHALKRRIIDENLIVYCCDICGLGPEWRGKPMPLILDHKNGINNDNRIDNLRFVCSNCDTQLPTYKSKNRKANPKDSG